MASFDAFCYVFSLRLDEFAGTASYLLKSRNLHILKIELDYVHSSEAVFIELFVVRCILFFSIKLMSIPYKNVQVRIEYMQNWRISVRLTICFVLK